MPPKNTGESQVWETPEVSCVWLGIQHLLVLCIFFLVSFHQDTFFCLFVSTSKPLPGEKVQCNLLQFAFGLSLSSVHFHKLGKGRQSLLFNLRIQVTLFLATGLNNENSCRSNGGVMCALEDLLGAGKAKNYGPLVQSLDWSRRGQVIGK